MTLYGRAVESRRPDALWRDPAAVDIVERLDCDWGRFDDDWITQIGVAVRTEILDDATRAFFARAAQPTVVNLGAGLCTRFARVDDGRVRWVDIDVPEVVAVRRALVAETDRYRIVAASILDPGWTDRLELRPDATLLFIAEGVLQYLDGSDVEALLTTIGTRFPGSEMLFDASSPAAIALARVLPSLRRAGVRPRWGYRGLASLAARLPAVEPIAEWRYDRHLERWGWIRVIRRLPGVTTLMRVAHVRLGAAT